ncbi:MAG: glycosyltransferase [Ignavibacteriales bacterium]|nr:glycosyltransferase [Ignavibacteriales bacterium]
MRITIVGTAYPLRGAFAQLNVTLAWHLSKKHSVEIITFKRQYPAFLFPGKTQKDPSERLFEIPTHILIDSINPLTWIAAARHIRKQNSDLVIFRYWMPFFAPCFGVISYFIRKRVGAKILFICDNVVPHERRFADAALTKFAFRFVDFFIVQSQSVEQELRYFVREPKYKLTPHPIYNIFGRPVTSRTARKNLGIQEEHVLLFFGYVRKYKGLGVLLRAMPGILKQLDARLLIVGEFYEEEKTYRRQIAQLGLEKKITVQSGYVPNEKISPYFSVCDVVVLPYLSATQSGIVQIANHFDKPVIVTNVGGLGQDVLDGKTGIVVPPKDPEALAEAVIQFFKKRKAKSFIKNIKREKRKNSWPKYVEVIEELVVR